MENVNERLARLEANEKTIFHQLSETEKEIKVLQQLTVAVERLANGQANITEKLDSLDNRFQKVEENLSGLEKQPAEDFKYYKRLIFGTLLTSSMATLATAILSLV